jgi:hypothetical protein
MRRATDGQGTYEPRDAIKETTTGLLIGGFVGLTAAAIKTSLTKHNVGAMAVFTRNGGLIGLYAAPLAAYSFTSTAAANLREKNDSYNEAIGGFFGGAAAGLYMRSLRSVLGFGLGVSILLATADYGGGLFKSTSVDPEIDQVSLKEYWRRNRRKPIEQTVEEIGEGRGIRPPGYQERRRERLKEKYGIEVQPTLTNQTD